MSAETSIQWTDKTWNPIRGCALVSEGCRNCYAMKVARRFSNPGGPYEGLTQIGPAGPRWTGKIRVVEEALTEPLRWRKPRRIFVNSMSDLFHEDVPDEFIDRVFAVMASCPRHTFQILTKRPERMQRYVSDIGTHIARAMDHGDGAPRWDAARRWVYRHVRDSLREFVGVRLAYPTWPLPNVWLGVSCEDQERADERIPRLLQTPAVVRFISAEPLLGPIDLEAVPLPVPGAAFYGLTGVAQPMSEKNTEPDDWKYWTRQSAKLDWVIPGGESGAKPRPCEIAWIRSLVQQCAAAGTACFVKQLGADARGVCNWPHHDECPPMQLDDDGVLTSVSGRPGTLNHAVDDCWWPCRLKLKDRKGGDMSEWPEELRVRQFPLTHREAVSV